MTGKHIAIDPHTTRMRTPKRIPFMVCVILLVIGILLITGYIAFVCNCCTESGTAIYKGYMTSGRSTMRPIVEIAGIEYISRYNQPVRDVSYIGKPVTIKYSKDDMHNFFIEWEE